MRPPHTTCNDTRSPCPAPAKRPAADERVVPRAADRPPTFDIELRRATASLSQPSVGERVTVTPLSRSDTVGELAAAVGASATDAIVVDGRPAGREQLLTAAGVVHGSVVAIAAPAGESAEAPGPASAESTRRAVLEVSIDSGPDCTGLVRLAVGRHVVGRSPTAHIRVADPSLGLHHAVLDVQAGAVTVIQLSGQAPIRIDGVPVDGRREVRPPARLSVGMNDLLLAVPPEDVDRPLATGRIVTTPTDPWRRVVQRGAAAPIEQKGDPITPPTPAEVQRTPPTTALVGAAAAVVGAWAITVLLGDLLLASLAAFGAVASAITWSIGAVSTWRGNRRSQRAADIDRLRFLDDLAVGRRAARRRHLIRHADLGQIFATADALAGSLPQRSDVWQRRLAGAGDGRATFQPVIGTGTSRWTPPLGGAIGPDSATDIDCAVTIDDVAIPLALQSDELMAISGGLTERDALLRSIVCQMAVLHGPADWQLVIVSADREKWAWARWLPHAQTATGTVLIADPADPDRLASRLARADGSSQRPTLLVVDDPALLSVRMSALGAFVERVRPAVLTTIEVGARTPASCCVVIEIGSTGAVMTTRLDGSTGGVGADASSISMCGLSTERAAHIARSLAKLVDPDLLAGSEELSGRAGTVQVDSVAGGRTRCRHRCRRPRLPIRPICVWLVAGAGHRRIPFGEPDSESGPDP